MNLTVKPKEITKEYLKELKSKGIKAIELEAISTNNYILKKCDLEHTYEDIKKASKLIRKKGFLLGLHVMVNLPDSTKIDEMNTAKELVKLKAKRIRVYCQKEIDMMTPAIERCKEMIYYFRKKKIKDITIESSNDNFSELVEDSIWYDSILEKIKKFNVKVKEIEIQINPVNKANVEGFEKQNLTKFKELYDVEISIKENKAIKIGKFRIEILKIYTDFIDDIKL